MGIAVLLNSLRLSLTPQDVALALARNNKEIFSIKWPYLTVEWKGVTS